MDDSLDSLSRLILDRSLQLGRKINCQSYLWRSNAYLERVHSRFLSWGKFRAF